MNPLWNVGALDHVILLFSMTVFAVILAADRDRWSLAIFYLEEKLVHPGEGQ